MRALNALNKSLYLNNPFHCKQSTLEAYNYATIEQLRLRLKDFYKYNYLVLLCVT